jgi:hypothetical protein
MGGARAIVKIVKKRRAAPSLQSMQLMKNSVAFRFPWTPFSGFVILRTNGE